MKSLWNYTVKRSALLFALFTMFLNFLGFTVFVPVIPFIVEKYVPGHQANLVGVYVGFLISIYAVCQFLSAPTLGMLADRYGRRPILLISLLGSIIGYILLGIGGAMWVLFLGRIIDGLTGGNISTVYAYVADTTPPENRSKVFGLLGAAGGVGFIVGPVIGGYIGAVHLFLPFFVGAAITLINLLWGYFVLKESLKPEHKLQHVELSHLNPFVQFKYVLKIQSLRQIFLIGFLFIFPLTAYQSMNSTFMKDVMQFGPAGIGTILLIVGVVDIVAQGYLTHKLLPIFGEVKLTFIGLIICIVGYVIYAAVPFFPTTIMIYTAVITVVLGDGLIEPALSGLISNNAEPHMQGRVQGAAQGMWSGGRAVGPLYGGWAYHINKSMPYIGNIVLTLIALAALLVSAHSIRDAKNLE